MGGRAAGRALAFLTSLALVLGAVSARTPQAQTHSDDIVSETVARGIVHRRIIRSRSTEPVERWVINVLEVDPSAARLSLGLALDEVVGTETTSSLARRSGAIAAVNGGYFRTTGTIRGEPMGLLERNGKLLSEPVVDRAAFSSGFDGRTLRVAFTHPSAALETSTSKATHKIDGINRPRETNELVLYTAEFHRNTLTTPAGCEVTIVGSRVRSITRQGSAAIPVRGYVLSGEGNGAEWLERNLRTRSRVDVRVRAIHTPSLGFQPDFSIGGGPMLIAQGGFVGEVEFGTFSESLTRSRHPRTAAGAKANGQLIFVTVDGRQPEVSLGMTIAELTALMSELGCVDAINLDGGGSTTMVIRGKVVNHPSDTTGERAVSDAMLIFSRP
jgi:hypothetical protein